MGRKIILINFSSGDVLDILRFPGISCYSEIMDNRCWSGSNNSKKPDIRYPDLTTSAIPNKWVNILHLNHPQVTLFSGKMIFSQFIAMIYFRPFPSTPPRGGRGFYIYLFVHILLYTYTDLDKCFFKKIMVKASLSWNSTRIDDTFKSKTKREMILL